MAVAVAGWRWRCVQVGGGGTVSEGHHGVSASLPPLHRNSAEDAPPPVHAACQAPRDTRRVWGACAGRRRTVDGERPGADVWLECVACVGQVGEGHGVVAEPRRKRTERRAEEH